MSNYGKLKRARILTFSLDKKCTSIEFEFKSRERWWVRAYKRFRITEEDKKNPKVLLIN